jgi:uroporphyrinogen-III synthase
MMVVAVGGSGAQALVEEAQRRGFRSLLHPCGRDRHSIDAGAIRIDTVTVYAAMETGDAAGLARFLMSGDVLLIHSPRAGERLAALTPLERRRNFALAAISPQSLRAAGAGWARADAVERPDDSALLALGARVCE